MDRTVQKYVEAMERLFNQNMGAPTVYTASNNTRWLLARDGRAMLWLEIRSTNQPPADHVCTLSLRGDLTDFSEHAEQYSGDTTKHFLPSKQVVARLKKAVPVPIEDLWVVVEQGKIVEFMCFTNTVACMMTGASFVREAITIGFVEEGRRKPLCMTINSLRDLRPFWRLVSQGKVVPGRDHLRKTDFKFGNTPDGKKDEGGFLIDGRLFMHPDDRKRYPNLTAQDLVNVSDQSNVVNGGPGTMYLFQRR